MFRTILKPFAILTFALLAGQCYGQTVQRWNATTGDVAVTTNTTATIQQPASNASQLYIEQILVYCSAACSVTQAVYGTAATTTAGTIIPLVPTPLNQTAPFNFYTASNVGAGTQQGPIVHIPPGSSIPLTLCVSVGCAAQQGVTLGTAGGTLANYSVTVTMATGAANINFIVRTQ
jgi:hypothetical protein